MKFQSTCSQTTAAMAINGTKRRKLGHAASEDEAAPLESSKASQKAFFKNAANWDLEQDYESRPRKGKKQDKESNRLPIKTADGRLEVLRSLQDEELSVESDTEWLEGREDDMDSEPESEAHEEAPAVPESQQILEAQEELAKIAMVMNENPEEHVGAFKALAKIGQSEIHTIRILAILTQMAVYKDVIPGYRIRPQSEDGPREQLSKGVRTLRQYEQALVAGYQSYIKELARCAKLETKPGPSGQSLSSVAIKAACTLVTAVPHFNFRQDLVKILVGKLSKRRADKDSAQCRDALETLFREDEDGRPSMEAASLLSKMMKAREYQVDEMAVNLFLSLRLLSEFSGKASRDTVEQSKEGGPRRQKKEFRTKRERKAIKEQKALQKDMDNADAMVSHEEQERMQSETLKVVFASYFRILKLRVPHLMGAVLEGLAKYAHLINQDFFGDLLEALKDLIRHSDEDANAEVDPEAGEEGAEAEDDDDIPVRNLTREALLCTVTAFALLAGQDAHNSRNQLHLDLSFFITHLYRSLLPLSIHPDLELTRPAGASATSKINVQTTTVLLLRSLTAILLPSYNIRSVPPLRLAAFTKQLMGVALHLPEKSCQGVLALLGDVAHTHGKKVNSMWNTEERKGDGRFIALSESVEGSNPFAATVWEGELLRKHFSPKVREGAKLVEKGMST
ncbi:nuclear export protein Noc3 [Stachybotrys elegans]|uniref:Nucleolar complex-associated protein 3 n=1 Tax=Stachybotrys elegans TaxID=80388 RepID=A0A8K0SRP9_9HYPO|nr:nuclear export protein Noc3 [Stachybotrys elegans]